MIFIMTHSIHRRRCVHMICLQRKFAFIYHSLVFVIGYYLQEDKDSICSLCLNVQCDILHDLVSSMIK